MSAAIVHGFSGGYGAIFLSSFLFFITLQIYLKPQVNAHLFHIYNVFMSYHLVCWLYTKTRHRMEQNILYRYFPVFCLEAKLYPSRGPKNLNLGIPNPSILGCSI